MVLYVDLGPKARTKLRERAGNAFGALMQYVEQGKVINAVLEENKGGGFVYIPGLEGHFPVKPHMRNSGNLFAASYHYGWSDRYSGHGTKKDVRDVFY